MAESSFPGFVTELPRADIPFAGVTGWLSQAEDHQVVFMEIEPIGEVSPHSHGAQWGIVVEGEMDLTIGDETRTYRRGDSYHIPAGVVHGAVFRSKVWVIDVFAERDRYRAKESD